MSFKITNLVSGIKFINRNIFEIIFKENVVKIRSNVKNVKIISSPYFHEIELNRNINICSICNRIQNDCNLCKKFNSIYFIKQFD